MDIVLVRHGESEGNAQQRLQGRIDAPLTELGRSQAERLATWLRSQEIAWEHLYASPLRRAWETAEIITRGTDGVTPRAEPALAELDAGSLEGLSFDEIGALFPTYRGRRVTELGDFAEYGGESYESVQARAAELRARLEAEHREGAHRVVLVGHGGFNFQLLKQLVCEPVPRVCLVRMGNCSATMVRLRERRGTYMGEVFWHVPVELMGGSSAEGSARLFR